MSEAIKKLIEDNYLVVQILNSNDKLVNYNVYTSFDEAKKLRDNLSMNYNEYHYLRILAVK